MAIKQVSFNRKALHEYMILEKFEAGMVLMGTEIKSIRQGSVQFKDAYVTFINHEAFIKEMYIAPYEEGNRFNHEATRERKLLLHDHEISKLEKKVKLKGFTVVPLSLYLKDGRAKLEMRDPSVAPQVKMGPGVATLSPMPADRTGERPTGLENVDHRVLTYRDLKSLAPNPDKRSPSREIDVHLTANMERYMWSFDGVKFSDKAEPLAFRHNERVRVNLINDTMMPHPIHLHGHFFEVVTGNPGHHPMKHTVNVLPGGKVSFDLTADALGDWAFHCHMLLHMHAGMFRVVTVRHEEEGA